jgi:quercetin dioxygenase-like cupin family protein
VKATGFFYLKLPAGQVQDWHTAPRRQYVVALSGRHEFELEDGEKIPLTPGTVILAEDLTGKGHLSRCVGPQDCIVVEVPLADQK